MENKSHALAAGLFVLVVAAMLAGLAIWLTRDDANYEQYEMSTKDGVSGLQPQATVRYKGVAVGKVTRIGFDPQVTGNVLIRIAVNEQAPITPTTFAELGYQGVTGLAHVQLDDADQPYPELPPGPSGLPRLPLKPSPFGKLAEQAPAILTQVEEATRRINQLLGDTNQQLLTQTLGNISSAAAGVNTLTQKLDATVTQRLDPALASLPPLAGEARKTLQALQQAGNSVTTLASDFSKTTQRITAEGGAIDQITLGTQALARAADQFGTTTLPRVNRAADDTSLAARRLSRAAGSITDNPQLFIYGSGRIPPGPGESGFAAP
ncbi:MAG: MCE family protein [Gammaproteobacteria bacterium]|jgi:phospholipid/cholesterol/gamma-HCH transport system substrate-binding protein|nr:MCE family protein [Gammaproteobacteria bacterium]MBU0830558.1 MCE family protein [Gammaproteobacteria bacterium]MBU0890310.1 MCE family protein [Gammaproteobacteria bacterium]MBU1353732.1 MCE family protein [Gammaproteobacteria bacterium]MBU1507933.1 MCE family protein [Gammaproteobacteria bacterium]